MQVMRSHLEPGITEQRLWSYLHAESIARGGEWIETRLLASGPRCNARYQECSSRKIEEGDLVAFDTNLVGSFGLCVDTSRTWLCGSRSPLRNSAILQPRVCTDPGLYHGVGLCDEAPYMYFPEEWQSCGYDGVIEPGMVMCVESYLGRTSVGPGAKLEEQVLVTETGCEVLTRYPFENQLLG